MLSAVMALCLLKFTVLNDAISYITARNCKFLKCTFVCTGIGIAYMKKVLKKYRGINSRGKNDKYSVFDVVTSCSIFDKYMF